MKFVQLLAIIALALFVVGCFPYVGRGDYRPVGNGPVQILDARTDNSIPRVVIIPRYNSAWIGFRNTEGAGPGGDGVFYVKAPFFYVPETEFLPKEPKIKAIVWGGFWAFTGKFSELEGFLVLCPGYTPIWAFVSDIRDDRQIKLKRISNDNLESSAEDFVRLLTEDTITGQKSDKWFRPRFTWDKGKPTELRLKRSERREIRLFLLGIHAPDTGVKEE